MPANHSDRLATARSDPFSQLPPHIAVQYAYLRRAASLAETLADLIILARDYMRVVTHALTRRPAALPIPANSDAKATPLAAEAQRLSASAANSDPAPRIA